MKRLSPSDLFHWFCGIEPTRYSFCLTIISMARPAIILGHFYDSCLHRVQMNVTDHRSQIIVRVNEYRLVAAPKQRAIAAMAPIESLGVDPVHVAHDPGEIAFRRSKTEMIVVPHQRIGEDFDSPQPMGFGEGAEECFIVTIVGKRRLSRRTPIHDMIDGSGKLDSQWTRHGMITSREVDN